MARVLYIRLNEAEAEARGEELRALGHLVEVIHDRGEVTTRLREEPPDLLLLDLDRVPSAGLYIGTFARQRKATRRMPLVYVGGAPAKVQRVRDHLPDATFCVWDEVGAALERALAAPPRDPEVPVTEELFVDRSLHQKLGLKPGARIALVGFDAGYDLGPLPEGAQLRRRAQGKLDVAFLFAGDARALEKRLERVLALAEAGCATWVAWDKAAGALTLPSIRAAANARGLVDFKVCKLPGELSATRLSRRRAKK